jgi:hypothetical protein
MYCYPLPYTSGSSLTTFLASFASSAASTTSLTSLPAFGASRVSWPSETVGLLLRRVHRSARQSVE